MIPPTMKSLLQNLVKLQDLEFSDVTDGKTESQISELRRKIPLPILEHYDRLTARGKTGIAAVRHQVCMGCHMRIPIGAIVTLMHAADIQMCESCGRYLYLPAEEKNELPELCAEARSASTRRRPRQKNLVGAV